MSFLAKLFTKSKHVQPDEVLLSIYDQLKLQASALLDEGKLAEAELTYLRALHENSQSSEAYLNLGYVQNELSRTTEAIDLIDKAIALDASNFDAHFLRAMLAIDENDLDTALRSIQFAVEIDSSSMRACSILYKVFWMRGEYSEIENDAKFRTQHAGGSALQHVNIARALLGLEFKGNEASPLLNLALGYLQLAIEIGPDNAETLTMFGSLLMQLNKPEQAIKGFERAVLADPSYAEAHYKLGLAHKIAENFLPALKCLEKAVSINPKYPDAQKLLGDIHYRCESFEVAAVAYQKAVELKPSMVDAHIALGGVLSELTRYDAAISSINIAIQLEPDAPECYFALGNVLLTQSKYLQAVANYRKALSLRPDYADAQINAGAAFLSMGNYVDAMEMFRDILKIEPDHLLAHNNIAYCSSFDANCSPSEYLENALAYGKASTLRAKPYTSWSVNPLISRRLKVGLVSGDFCMHPVGFFLESVISYFDTEKIELHAFSNRTTDDPLQTSLKSRVDSWTSIVGLDDSDAAKLVYEKKLDLLIDLSGHTGKNRLSLFAWRPAPVQATWLGYWASTGVSEIDFILSDKHGVPPENQNQFSEKVWYLHDTRLCFTPPSKLYELTASQPPCIKNGYITFGCYQHLRKLTADVLALWGAIFKQLPHARFRLQSSGFTDPHTSEDLLLRLAKAGIPKTHIILHDSMPRLDYLKSHAEVDIILDSFPYPGGTTTCDALWMGVPTITLAGNSMLSRQGVSLLMCAGLSDWVAHSEDDYVTIAVINARNIPQLCSLRSSLRKRVFESPLFDAPNFARHLEDTLHKMVQSKKNVA